jgi:hypothetical protein
MTMPGFSAETSTYKSTDLYRRYGVAASIIGAPKVNPAQTDCEPLCAAACTAATVACLVKCQGGDGDGGGGGGCCPPGRTCCGSCASGKCDDACIGPGQSCP